jgi:hypothetical protein
MDAKLVCQTVGVALTYDKLTIAISNADITPKFVFSYCGGSFNKNKFKLYLSSFKHSIQHNLRIILY